MREYLEQGYLQAQVCLCSRDVVDLDVDVDEMSSPSSSSSLLARILSRLVVLATISIAAIYVYVSLRTGLSYTDRDDNVYIIGAEEY